MPRTGRSPHPWLSRGCLSLGRLQPACNGNLAPSLSLCHSSSTCQERVQRVRGVNTHCGTRGASEEAVLVWFSSCRVLGCELDLHLGGGLGGMARHVWTSRLMPMLVIFFTEKWRKESKILDGFVPVLVQRERGRAHL